MKVCIVAEGCYPYVVGGVSSWVHSLIQQFPNIEFTVAAIVADRSISGKFAYTLPDNLTEVREIYLNDSQWLRGGKRNRKARVSLKTDEYEALRALVLGEKVNWHVVFQMFQEKHMSVDQLLMGKDFLNIAKEVYELRYTNIVFSDFLWTLRSIYLPLGFALQFRPEKADLYHCVATGYSGVIGSMAKDMYGSRLLVSEHGIYTREREEEIIKARWVQGVYKDFWIEQFRKLSLCAYDHADMVTSLFENARSLQLELGCQEEKTRVTPNGIEVEDFEEIPGKEPGDEMINVGAILRVAPIKDVKTMINAFYYAKKREPKLKLWIMGPWDEDEEYAQECFELVENLQVKDIVFTGRIDTKEYIGKMDMLILTSISEGQPLTVLEGFAAKKPMIATNVGNCEGLIYGESDDLGDAGIVLPVMNIGKISDAIVELASDEDRRRRMGEIGYQRVCGKYRIEYMRRTYEEIYRQMAADNGVPWPEETFDIEKQEGAD
ncbi:GT4 family glycosyltransferase PelF [Ruminococcus sp. CLA-AA-H200]|uniref:GT4 family glycosyltransferase PelF n=1 Tax=Ruminococcus turbiniformis TaxID=2881258 RepID=A0ABS8G1M4_9FIRM|nr:GT4 family glycosyltransferase PelF [Ruminococcus turbiniformis]MCC2255322.1 GT4 family glycosyltransferase PelF [Ruminococcus turbiniformis]